MLAAVAALVVALSLGGPPKGRPHEARQAAPLSGSNAARARMGLLPRKPPPRAVASREGRRVIRTTSLKPTFLGEPGTLADLDTLPPPPPPPAPGDRSHLRLSARGVTTDVTISMRFDR